MKNKIIKLLILCWCLSMALFTFTACEKECEHKESDWVVKTPATCIEKGLTEKICLSCEKVLEQQVLETVEHTESDWIMDDNATCETGGLKHKECTVCDAILQVKTVVKGEHTESGWIVDQNATCLNSGIKHKECTECETILDTIVIDKLNHTESGWIIDQNATCLNSGIKHKECTDCETILQIGAIDKVHSYVDYVCEFCDGEYYTEGLIFSIDGNYAYVTGIEDQTATEIVIPSKYVGLPVIIESVAFKE
ncbi:MAG: hypothetical protein IJX03_07935, partial [Clostridia bacterium]|nr:hypothetical protein [Clostridia bacterium]